MCSASWSACDEILGKDSAHSKPCGRAEGRPDALLLCLNTGSAGFHQEGSSVTGASAAVRCVCAGPAERKAKAVADCAGISNANTTQRTRDQPVARQLNEVLRDMDWAKGHRSMKKQDNFLRSWECDGCMNTCLPTGGACCRWAYKRNAARFFVRSCDAPRSRPSGMAGTGRKRA